jgi:hypothetical protein
VLDVRELELLLVHVHVAEGALVGVDEDEGVAGELDLSADVKVPERTS